MISDRMAASLRKCTALFAALAGAWTAPAALAQVTATEVDQTVDQVEVFSLGKLLRLKFDNDPTNVVGLAAAPASAFRACQSSAEGLTCLDGQIIRRWQATTEHPLPPDGPVSNVPGVQLFSCADSALGFKAGNPCTALTVDAKGGVWVAGQKPSNLYSLRQFVKKNAAGSCPVATPAFTSLNQSTGYCFRERVANRAKIVDLSPVEGRFVEDYFSVEGEGVFGIEATATAVFYPFDFSKALRTFGGWPGAIQSAAFFQRVESSSLKSYLLVTVSSGMVYSRALSEAGTPTTAFVHANSDSDALALDRGSACFTGLIANQFRVRSSEASGRVFVTNRNYCRVFVLTPNPGLAGIDVDYEALSTKFAGGGTYTPEGLAVAAGAAINLADCTGEIAVLGAPGGCTVIEDGSDANEYPAMRMYSVNLEPGSPTGLRIFKIVGIPDCRYLIRQEVPPAECLLPGVVVEDPKILNSSRHLPQRQYLNVTPMLPSNIKDAFDNSGKKPTGLPAMLIQPRYRAQAQNGFYFDAIFGIVDPNTRFRETFTVEFDIGDPNLGGPALGCGLQQLPTPLPFTQLDIGTVVSERYSSVGGPLGIVKDTVNSSNQLVAAEHVDTLIIKGCYNPTPKAGTRWSMYSYNMELAEDTPVRATPSGPVTGFAYARSVNYLGNLLLALHTELGEAQKKLACGNVDAIGNTGALAGQPLPAATCSALESQWNVAQGYLASCAAASATDTSYPTVCDSFYTAFSTFKTQSESAAAAVSGANVDPANRAGELWSRTDVIKYMFLDHFKKAWDLGQGATL